MPDFSWHIGGDYDAWKTTSADEREEDGDEMDEETLGDIRYHERVDREIEERDQ